MKTVYLLLELNHNNAIVQIIGVFEKKEDALNSLEAEKSLTRNELTVEEYSVL